MLLDPICGIYEGRSTLEIDPQTLFSDSLNQVSPSEVFSS
jgi:hypothetical protein